MDFGSSGDYATYLSRRIPLKSWNRLHHIWQRTLSKKAIVRYCRTTIRIKMTPVAVVCILTRKRAHHFGFERREIQSLLQQAFGEESIGYIQHDVFRENIFVELLPRVPKVRGSLGKLYLTSPTGEAIPFKAVASWEEKLGVSHLKRSYGPPISRRPLFTS